VAVYKIRQRRLFVCRSLLLLRSVDEKMDKRRRGAWNFWERRTERMHLRGGLGKREG